MTQRHRTEGRPSTALTDAQQLVVFFPADAVTAEAMDRPHRAGGVTLRAVN
jgi:hypothetical protein